VEYLVLLAAISILLVVLLGLVTYGLHRRGW
jgi:hypothetical protein